MHMNMKMLVLKLPPVIKTYENSPKQNQTLHLGSYFLQIHYLHIKMYGECTLTYGKARNVTLYYKAGSRNKTALRWYLN